MRSRNITVSIDLDHVRAAAERIRAGTGVRLISVIKADAYGLGAARVADAIAAVTDDFAYFSVHEARETGRPGIVLGPPEGEPAHYRELNLRPTVTNLLEAERFGGENVIINVDTGMQRFGCPLDAVDDLLRRTAAHEAWTHASDPRAAAVLRDVCAGRVGCLHAASTALLDNPAALLDGVRPGLALYRGAVRVAGRLEAVRDTHGPVGYTGFERPRVGILLAGYCHHLRPGPVLVNGRRQQILEVGMNTCFISADPVDRAGDEVVLLGDGISEAELARVSGTREHEVLCRFTAMGQRTYAESPTTFVAPAPDPGMEIGPVGSPR